MNSNISDIQIKKAFSKIKEDMDELFLRIEKLETENKQLKKQIEQNQTENQSSLVQKPDKFLGNVLSGKIHVPDCPYAKKIASQNLEVFDDIKQAIRLKYKKCSCIAYK